MPSDASQLQYRLEKLEFHNGAILGFKKAIMQYRDDNREIAITNLGIPPLAMDANLRKIANHDGTAPTIRTIYYEMVLPGYKAEAFFYHPMSRGAEVYIEGRLRGQNVIYFNQAAGRPIFSKEWTLRQVTQGRIPIDKAVWQFHGYKHEH